MARPIKTGLDYFPLDVDFLDDMKVRKIMRACGSNSISILICLLGNIYKNGYYIVWNEDMTFLIADKIGVSEGAVLELIKKAVDVDFFDKTQFKTNKIITSNGIQKRYKEITSKFKRKEFNLTRFLVNPEETLVNAEETPVNAEETPVNAEETLQKERKEKEIENINKLSIVSLSTTESFNLFWDLYHRTTMLPKTDRDAALKYWVSSLGNSERQKAIDCIEPYFNSLRDKKYCKKARTYLANKNFNDEFKVLDPMNLTIPL